MCPVVWLFGSASKCGGHAGTCASGEGRTSPLAYLEDLVHSGLEICPHLSPRRPDSTGSHPLPTALNRTEVETPNLALTLCKPAQSLGFFVRRRTGSIPGACAVE